METKNMRQAYATVMTITNLFLIMRGLTPEQISHFPTIKEKLIKLSSILVNQLEPLEELDAIWVESGEEEFKLSQVLAELTKFYEDKNEPS